MCELCVCVLSLTLFLDTSNATVPRSPHHLGHWKENAKPVPPLQYTINVPTRFKHRYSTPRRSPRTNQRQHVQCRPIVTDNVDTMHEGHRGCATTANKKCRSHTVHQCYDADSPGSPGSGFKKSRLDRRAPYMGRWLRGSALRTVPTAPKTFGA